MWYNDAMDSARVKAYAKINLTLDITGSLGGYHLIDSVVASVDLYDTVTVKKRKDGLVRISMRGMGSEAIPFERNNAVRAAEGMIERFGCGGVDISVLKNIPMGAGLGGSSADAAGVLNAMKKLYCVGDGKEVEKIAGSVGSDCGYMLTGGYARLGGRGERVQPVECGEVFHLLLLIPPRPVGAGECYGLYDRLGAARKPSGDAAEEALRAGDRVRLGKCLSNSLFPSAVALNADVGKAAEQLAAFAPLGVNMTGSGSAVYALFENSALRDYAASRYRGPFRCLKTKTYIPKGRK